MNKLIYLLSILILVKTNLIAGPPKIYAVIIGVANYKDNAIPNLKFSEKDAKDFNDFLKSPFAGAVPSENILLLTGADATRANIITSMVNMSKRCTKDDMVIFYFSGHGEADEGDNSGYLLSYDASSDNAPATAISMEEINSRLLKCNAKLKVSYVDACHAGMFSSSGKGSMDADNEIIASSFMQSVSGAGEGNVAFLASSAKQQSQESNKLGNGVFTYYLLKGLKGEGDKFQKEAKGYSDGIVTVGEMITYLNDKIPAETKYNQKPSVQGNYDDEFPLSILSSNVQISNEIAKRPSKKLVEIPKVSKQVETAPSHDIVTKTMAANECKITGYTNYYYSGLCFINNYSEDIVLYSYNNNNTFRTPNVMLAKGEKNCLTGAIVIGDANSTTNLKLYFKTTDETKPIKYGILTYNIEGCKIKTEIISNKNLYLSTTGEKHN